MIDKEEVNNCLLSDSTAQFIMLKVYYKRFI